MHYSNYLKCSRMIEPEPVCVQVPVMEPIVVSETSTNIPVTDVIVDTTIATAISEQPDYPEMKPEDIQLPQQLEQQIPDDAINMFDKLAKQTAPVIREFTTNMKLINEAIEQYQVDPPTQLNENQTNIIMEYLFGLQGKYFEDIPLSANISKSFVWNIPMYVYEDMKEAIDNGSPDVLNPMFPFYILLTDYPGLAMGRFVKIMNDLAYDNINLINKCNQEYLERLEEIETDDDGDYEISFDVSDEE